MDYNKYSGNNDFRGFLAANAPQYLSFVGNDGGIDNEAFAAYANSKDYQLPTSQIRTQIGDLYNGWSNREINPTPTYDTGTGATAEDIAYLEDQRDMLSQLLNRIPTTLQQGLTRNQDEYDTQAGEANREKEQAYAGFEDQRGTQGKRKVENFGTINRQANTGYRSLAALLGRASGTGSSAFRELLPDVVGKDISLKRRGTLDTFGENMQGIQKAQNQYDSDFQGVINDLVRQKKSNEERLRSGIEEQRQTILGQQATNAGALAAARGGDYNAIRAAQIPFREQVQASMNNVEGFFDKYRTPYQRRAAVAQAPELANYTADRSAVEANQQGLDPSNPYASLLRKRLTEQA